MVNQVLGGKEERLKQLVEVDPLQTSCELAAVPSLSQRSVSTHLQAVCKVDMLGQWVPHDLSDWDCHRRPTNIAESTQKSCGIGMGDFGLFTIFHRLSLVRCSLLSADEQCITK